jgi:hypothetical protein
MFPDLWLFPHHTRHHRFYSFSPDLMAALRKVQLLATRKMPVSIVGSDQDNRKSGRATQLVAMPGFCSARSLSLRREEYHDHGC